MEVREWFWKRRLEKAAEALRKNGFAAYVASNSEEARELVLNLVPPGSVVGVGGSVTVRELGLIEELERRGFKVVHHWVKAPQDRIDELRRMALNADVFLSSSNAVTMDGKLVNVDGVGNRVAAMIFGPRRVVVVAGRNKLVKNVEEGIERAKSVAAIMNSKRLGLRNPCVEAGRCIDCDSPLRVCRVVVVLERKPARTDFHVVLVNEELGF